MKETNVARALVRAVSRLISTPFVLCVSVFSISAAQPDPVFDAMRAEMKRATTLSLNQLDKPYFVSYALDDGRNWSATATLGALISSDDSRFRIPQVRIRV